jgi:hypothetical protein
MPRRVTPSRQHSFVALGVIAAAMLAGCAPAAYRLTGAPRPPIVVAQVRVYPTPPPQYQEIAVINAWHRSAFSAEERSQAIVTRRLKAEAAKLGANGLILDGFDLAETGSLGAGAGTDSYSAHGTINLDLGAWFPIFRTIGKGRAIYVPIDAVPQNGAPGPE